jgi:hypothetical protein
LQKKFSKKGFVTLNEPRIPLENSFCKPDLIIIEGARATVMDIQICGEAQMDASYAGKVNKYGATNTHQSIVRYLQSTNSRITQVDHQPVIINLRGVIHPRSAISLKLRKFNQWDISDVCLRTIIGSLKTYDVYTRGN